MVKYAMAFAIILLLGASSIAVAMDGFDAQFHMMDNNNNGHVTHNEFSSYFKNKPHTDHMYSEADRNGDDVISSEEWEEFRSQMGYSGGDGSMNNGHMNHDSATPMNNHNGMKHQ